LTHRSWTYENQSLVSASNQRDYGVLATEGSEILAHLVRHRYALQRLNNSFQIPSGAVISPAVTSEVVAGLFDQLPIAAGVLRGRGQSALPTDLKSDVMQALVATSWRVNGDLLARKQVSVLANWIESFVPPADPTTQLQEYCARAKVSHQFSFDQRGPDHQQEFRGTVTFEVDGTPRWSGSWSPSRTAAKHSAAAGALDCLLGTGIGGDDLRRGFFLAELRAVDPDDVSYQRELASGRLGIDLLASRQFADFLRWSTPRSTLVPRSGSAAVDRLAAYYEAVLIKQKRQAVRRWIVQNTPGRGVESPDAVERIRDWWASDRASRLALLEDLLRSIEGDSPTAEVVDFIESQARTVASAVGATLEVDRGDDDEELTLAVRLRGVDLSAALKTVITLVEGVVGGSTWIREPQAVSVMFKVPPKVTDPVSEAGVQAMERTLHDPWLQRTRRALADFLSLTERLFGGDSEPTGSQIEELSLAELSLILQLRTDDEEE
jgi:hypothetical protein